MASNKQNLDKDALVYLIEQIINGDEAVEEQLDGIAGEISPIIGRTNITDEAFEIVDAEGNVMASYGGRIVIGRSNPIIIEDGAIYMGEGGELYIPNPENLLIRYPGEDYRPARMARRSGLTSNGWAWEISTITKRHNIGRGDDSMLTAYAVDTYTPTSGNTQFINGLYYKDTTKSIASLIADTEGDWQYWEGQPHIIAQANGNTGSGYVSVWRSYLDIPNKVIRTRLVSNSANAMGTVTIAYELRMMMCYFDEEDDFE